MKNKNENTLVLSLKLFLICLCVAFALSSLNFITKDVIAKREKDDKDNAMAEIMEDCEFESLNDENTVYLAKKDGKDAGYCVNVISPKGYGGKIEMIIGFDNELKVVGIKYISMSETPGLGMNAKTDENFNNQFKGKEAFSDNELEAITGATITSKAVNYGVNVASDMIKEVVGQ